TSSSRAAASTATRRRCRACGSWARAAPRGSPPRTCSTSWARTACTRSTWAPWPTGSPPTSRAEPPSPSRSARDGGHAGGDVGAQGLLVDLADLRGRELADQLEALGELEPRHAGRVHRLPHLVEGERGPGARDDVDADPLPQLGVGHRDRGDLAHGGQLV